MILCTVNTKYNPSASVHCKFVSFHSFSGSFFSQFSLCGLKYSVKKIFIYICGSLTEPCNHKNTKYFYFIISIAIYYNLLFSRNLNLRHWCYVKFGNMYLLQHNCNKMFLVILSSLFGRHFSSSTKPLYFISKV